MNYILNNQCLCTCVSVFMFVCVYLIVLVYVVMHACVCMCEYACVSVLCETSSILLPKKKKKSLTQLKLNGLEITAITD